MITFDHEEERSAFGMNTTFEKTRLGICLVLAMSFVTAGSVASSDRTLLLRTILPRAGRPITQLGETQ
jgi:hypothetical protein